MDLDIITQKLESLERCINRVESTCPSSAKALETDIDAQDIVTLNLSRAVQQAVDICSHILASTNSPAPDTMGESFERMQKLGVLDDTLALNLRKAVGFRNIAVHNYEAINWEVVYSIVTERLSDFVDFARAIEGWIDRRAKGQDA